MSALVPTPLGPDGAPLAARPRWWRELDAAAVLAWWAGEVTTPVVGERHRVGGVDLVEVTFVVAEPDDGVECMVHLNGLTDAHREHLDPALLRPVPGTPLRALHLLLPADGTYGYRIVRGSPLDRAAGRTRPGWKAVHEAGRPDPRNPELLPHALGEVSSVWSGPAARLTPGWGVPDDLPEMVVGPSRRVWARPGDGRWLVLHDGAHWRRLGVGPALRQAGLGAPGLVLVDAGDAEQRAADLPDPHRAAEVTAEAVRGVEDALGLSVAGGRVVIAGQSFGGLAAASTVVLRPDVTRLAVAQSASFWWDGDGGPGRLERLLTGADLCGRVLVVQAGTDEPEMFADATRFAASARAAGAEVDIEQWRGGHDYAWWRHGLVEGLRHLGSAW